MWHVWDYSNNTLTFKEAQGFSTWRDQISNVRKSQEITLGIKIEKKTLKQIDPSRWDCLCFFKILGTCSHMSHAYLIPSCWGSLCFFKGECVVAVFSHMPHGWLIPLCLDSLCIFKFFGTYSHMSHGYLNESLWNCNRTLNWNCEKIYWLSYAVNVYTYFVKNLIVMLVMHLLKMSTE